MARSTEAHADLGDEVRVGDVGADALAHLAVAEKQVVAVDNGNEVAALAFCYRYHRCDILRSAACEQITRAAHQAPSNFIGFARARMRLILPHFSFHCSIWM